VLAGISQISDARRVERLRKSLSLTYRNSENRMLVFLNYSHTDKQSEMIPIIEFAGSLTLNQPTEILL